MDLNKKSGFTLAETLITLTIIGVVAAMTIPTLMSKYQKHTYVVGLKKTYAQLQHALKMIPLTEGCPSGDYTCAGFTQGTDGSSITDVDGISFNESFNPIGLKRLYLISKNLKTRRICAMPNISSGLFASSSSDECQKLIIENDTPVYELIQLEDGTTIDTSGNVDVNGPKGPNKWGRDKFTFVYASSSSSSTPKNIPDGTLIPYGSKLYGDYYGSGYYLDSPNRSCTTMDVPHWSYLRSCTGRVLEEGAMNY